MPEQFLTINENITTGKTSQAIAPFHFFQNFNFFGLVSQSYWANQMDQINLVNQVNYVKHVIQVNQGNHVNLVSQVNRVNNVNWVNRLDEVNQVNHLHLHLGIIHFWENTLWENTL